MSRPIVPVGDRRPLSLRVYAALKERLRAGDYPPGERLPPEAVLAQAFRVSRVTVREALRLLERDGLVRAHHGRGHFVLPHAPIRESITELRSVTELLASLGYSVETELLEAREEPAGERAQLFSCDPDTPLTRLERVRSSDGMPLIYSIDILPAHVLASADASYAGSLLAALEERGVTIARAQATIRAAGLPRSIARRSGLPGSLPWLLLDQLHFDPDEQPVLWSLDYHRGDRFEFNVVRQRLHG